MKSKLTIFSVFILSAMLQAQKTSAVTSCLSGRMNDYKDLGCLHTSGGAGSLGTGAANQGSPDSPCPLCHTNGMPSWWVNEPYINTWVSDTPLSYTTSSGQEINFRWSYRQRGQVLGPWYGYETNSLWWSDGFLQPHVLMRYTLHKNPGSVVTMTNSSWQHSWWQEITFWDPNIETNSTAPTVTLQFGSDPNNPTNAFIPYTSYYQGLLYRGDGGTIPFSITNSSAPTSSGQIRVQVINPNSANGPNVPHNYQDLYTGNNDEPYPKYKSFFVTNAAYGFQVLYPDGSKEIYGLVLIHTDPTLPDYFPPLSPPQNIPPRRSTCGAYMTARVDPQGRTTWIGYEPRTNIFFNQNIGEFQTNFYGYHVKYVVDSDGRTNTYTYTDAFTAGDGLALTGITDPYGRTAYFNVNWSSGLTQITDPAGLTSSFSYSSDAKTWLTGLVTPYGTTSFSYYEQQESDAIDEFEQRATLVTQADGSHQLFCYIHNLGNGITTNVPDNQIPSVPGYTFDTGTTGSIDQTLNYRNSFHWDARQFAAISSSTRAALGSSLGTGVADLTLADYQKAGLQHWLLDGTDGISLTEQVSSQVDPSVDAAGASVGARTWYGYQGKPSGNPQEAGTNVVGCVARLLPGGSSQFVGFDYGANGLPLHRWESFTKADGTQSIRTNFYAYSTDGIDLLSVSNSSGQFVNLGYDTHQVSSITNSSLSQVTTLGYDTATHNLKSISLPEGDVITLSYLNNAFQTNIGTSGHPTNIYIYPLDNGFLTNISWATSGRSITLKISNSLPQIVHVTGTALTELWFTNYWDGLNQLTGRAFTDGTTTSNRFDLIGGVPFANSSGSLTILDPTATKDRLNQWTYYGYDAMQHLTSITDPLNNVTSYGWCGCGALTSITDAELTNTTSLYYDNQGNLINVVFPDGASFTNQIDLAGRLTKRTDGSGRYVQYGYNNQGLVTSVANTYGTLWQVNYDGVDRPFSITDPNNLTITNGFDLLNRLTNRVWPDHVGEEFLYTAKGLVAYTNRDNFRTQFDRDNAGRLIGVTNANLEVTRFAYNALDQVVTLTDPLTNITTWQYNEYGWLTNKLDTSNHAVLNLAYFANGQVKTRWTPAITNTGYLYDADGNLTNISYVNPAYPTHGISYAYDADNRLQTMSDALGTDTFTFTPAGQFQSETSPWTNATLTLGYTQGHRTSLTLAQPTGGNWAQTYVHDLEWRLITNTAPAGNFIYSYPASSPSALVMGIALPNSAAIVNTYDTLFRLQSTSLTNQWGHVLDGYTYGRDNLGLIKSVLRNYGLTTSTATPGYDKIGQLISWNASEANGTPRLNEQLGYGYDQAGNLHLRTNNALVQTFTPDNVNQLASISRTGTLTVSGATPAPAASVTINGTAARTYGDFTFAATNNTLANGVNNFTTIAQNLYGTRVTNSISVNLPTNVVCSYDGNGNLTSDGTRGFFYDAENELTNVTVTNGWKTEFVYDGFGRRRIEKDYTWTNSNWTKTNETHFVFDGMLPIQERDASDNVLVSYTRGLDLSGTRSGAGGIGGLLARTDANGTTYYHSDGAGNVTAMMDSQQNIVARYLYDPFGRQLGKWGAMADANRFRFSSKEFNANSGLYYYGFRFYDPGVQRWLNRDPIGEIGGLNLHEFVVNSPLNLVDPYGLAFSTFSVDASGGAYLPGPFSYVRGDSALEQTAADFANLSPTLGNGVVDAFQFAAGGISMGLDWLSDKSGLTGLLGASPSEIAEGINPMMAWEYQAMKPAPCPSTNLRGLTDEAHALLDRIGRQQKTTAIGRYANGSLAIASSDRYVPYAQKVWAMQRGIEVINGTGHAEVTLLRGSDLIRGALQEVEASRDICPECQVNVIGPNNIQTTTPFEGAKANR